MVPWLMLMSLVAFLMVSIILIISFLQVTWKFLLIDVGHGQESHQQSQHCCLKMKPTGIESKMSGASTGNNYWPT
jgi:hypothetical protein